MSSWDIVLLTDERWHWAWMPAQYVASHLASRHRVLFVSPPLSARGFVAAVRSAKKRTRGLVRVLPSLHVWTPPILLPVNHRYPRVEAAFDVVRRLALRTVLRRLGFVRPVLYILDPHYETYVGSLRERLVCYHIYDDQEGRVTGETAMRVVRAQEARLLQKSEGVFCITKSLITARGLEGRAQWLPNGVDFEQFESYVREGGDPPRDIASIPRPRIGYVGRINKKVDFELLESIARERPGWSIVMVGPVLLRERPEETEQRRLASLPNVYFLGGKERTNLPAYISALDVGLMCYQVRDWVVHGYPLKMHEYFACGIPVVSSDLAAVRDFKELLWIADTPGAWCHAIEAALKEGRARAGERIAVARENSWGARVTQIEQAIAAGLATKEQLT